MKKILVVDDSLRSQELIRSALQDQYQLVFQTSSKEAENYLDQSSIDLILLDIGLPGEDGLQFFSKMSGNPRRPEVPLIFLTAKNDISYKISAFKLGAVDYVVKPFEPAELALRIESRLKDSHSKNQISLHRDLYIDLQQNCLYHVTRQGPRRIELTPTEYRLACFFAENPDQVFTRNQIFDRVWGESAHYLDRTIDRHISSLKKKIDHFKLSIQTVYGAGYVYQTEVTGTFQASA